jgi:hypothetical protein
MPTIPAPGQAGDPTATANSLMGRDSAGRSQVVDPAVAADIATKNYVDNNAGSPADRVLIASCFR